MFGAAKQITSVDGTLLPLATSGALGVVQIGDFLTVNSGLISVDTDSLIEKIKESLSMNVIDLLDGNQTLTFSANNDVVQCPVDCILMTMDGNPANVAFSGDGTTYTSTQTVAQGLEIALKKNTFVKAISSYAKLVLYPCSKYTKNKFVKNTAGTETWRLAAGTYKFVIIGGGGGGAYVYQGDYFSASSGGSAACFEGTFTLSNAANAEVTVGSVGTSPTGFGYGNGGVGESSSIVIGSVVNMVAPGGNNGYCSPYLTYTDAKAGSATSYGSSWSGITCTGVTKTSVSEGKAGNATGTPSVGTATGALVANTSYPFGASYNRSYNSVGGLPTGASSANGYILIEKVES